MKYRSLNALLALATALLPVFVSCEKENDYKPVHNVKSTDWYTVSSSGGTVQINDITIDFPAGAFEKDGKVAVTPVKPGSVADVKGRELSEYYQLVFPESGVQKPFTISINYSGDAKRILVMEESYKRGRYGNITGLHAAPLGGTKVGDKMFITVPGIDPTDDGNPFFTIGLADATSSAPAPSTKADVTFHYTVTWDIETEAQVKKLEPYREAILKLFRQNLFVVPEVFNSLGIEISEYPVLYDICPLGGGWGEHATDNVCKSWGIVYLNTNELVNIVKGGEPYDQELVGQFQQSLVHETFHWIQDVVYDNRTAQAINKAMPGDWQMFSEAMATWMEKFTGNKRISENCPKFAENVLTDFFCENKKSHQDTGYGMGLFIEWLSQKTSNKKVIKLLDYLRDNSGWFSAPSLRSAFDSVLSDNKLTFFNPSTNWSDWNWAVYNKKLDDRVAPSLYGVQYQYVLKKDNEVVENSPVYNFGRTIQIIRIQSALRNKLVTNPGLSIAFRQNEDNLKTWVYDPDRRQVGVTEKGKPIAMSGVDWDKNSYFNIITERINQDTKPSVIKNNLSVELVPWPTFVEVEWGGGYDEYYSWSGDEIKVTYTSNGYYVECDYPGGSHMHFYIGWVNNRFHDVSAVYFWQDYNDSNRVSVGLLKLDYSSPSSIEKDLKWKGKYKGNDFYLHCCLK